MSRPLRPEEVQRAEDLFGPLTQALRTLVDVAIRSDADDPDVTRAHALIEQATELLSTRLEPEPFPVRTTTTGRILTWGNVAIGMRNAVAPPLRLQRDDTGRVTTDLTLGVPYEGPAGHVHGGVCALLLDHVLSATAHRPGVPAFTGTLSVRYVAPTRLGRLRVEAWTEREDGAKTFAAGHITDAEGTVTVQAEGVFIRPKVRS
ncbi:PaaI family thioesterase [Mycolicibacterium austroafricanum]|uniref:Acyl-coenzyme A thioesterase THEM4 n=1 Tax=Mycolicibacterium austroafricanum TaxID=39687 RepID=A0ABT8HJ57_MYCAO|nr:PaaI family thioesterase [Mycolicibacterium austroafricanum]MDN4520788.1 PaaI family thioesterase [Mycolicibacterium austroafricanum]PQP49803.1 thioesterase [Mycolicibacterium austroafricanum]QRZ09428.1 PaaI family thioesterase [Mycolicibacterium austroafricanum]QZT71080.1 PaaI family thioesterase [Mycolicibacterium austroafricanum]